MILQSYYSRIDMEDNERYINTIPRISVIVPLYNKVREVQRSIISIFNQTVQEYELLIIDGGSTDGSLEVISPYLEDDRVKLIHQKSKGLPAARNEAIQQAKGELIAFLDADDEWHPDFLETIIRLYKKYPGAGIYATAYERCAISYCKPSPVKGLPKSWEGYLDSWFNVYIESGFPPFCPCSVALHRDVFSKAGYFNPESRMSEDVEMWVKVAYHCPIVFTTEIHARYHLFADNKMSLDYYPIEKLPPVVYLESIPEEELRNHRNYQDIQLAMEYMNLVGAYFNLGAGDKKQDKGLIRTSSSGRWRLRRSGLWSLSLLPKCVGMFVIRCYAKLPLYAYYLHRFVFR